MLAVVINYNSGNKQLILGVRLKFLKDIHFYPIAIAAFPILALLASNIREVELEVGVRPLLLSITFAVLLIFILRLVIGEWQKASLLVAFFFLLFFSYGHIYESLQGTPILGVDLGHHRYLVVAYALVMVLGGYWILKIARGGPEVSWALNVIALIIVVIPIFQIANHLWVERVSEEVSEANSEFPMLEFEGDESPDIYYIILDAYLREDALLEDMEFDNSSFIQELTGLGFHVMECSRSNYGFTQASLTSSLNMAYLPDLTPRLESVGLDSNNYWLLLKRNLVREQLERIGYQTVAFDTGYDWSQLDDADYYFERSISPITSNVANQFERLLFRTTAGVVLTDFQYKVMYEQFKDTNLPYRAHVDRQLFLLDQLPKIPSIEEPTFSFVHILIPHVPYVFGPNGEILTDPGYFSGGKAQPVNEEYRKKGYTGQIEFINARMSEILEILIEESDVPPIIVLQADTGTGSGSEYKILNAYYLPDDGYDSLFSTISPVNTFRLIFDQYFGTSLGLLPDYSIGGVSKDDLVLENSEACLQLGERTN
jgi:hypothetical protein